MTLLDVEKELIGFERYSIGEIDQMTAALRDGLVVTLMHDVVRIAPNREHTDYFTFYKRNAGEPW